MAKEAGGTAGEQHFSPAAVAAPGTP